MKQEVEKRAELVRSALRALLSLGRACGVLKVQSAQENATITITPGTTLAHSLETLLQEAMKNPNILQQFQAIASEAHHNGST